EEQVLTQEAEAVAEERRRRVPAWLASFMVVFAAEWGDLTQLATAGLVAEVGQPLSVSIGAVGALWTVTVLAAVTGGHVGRLLSPTVLSRESALVFAGMGVFVTPSALVP